MAPRWRYLAGEVVIGLRRNLLMTLATVVTVTVSLALLGVGILVFFQVNLAREVLYADLEVSIFLDRGVAQEQKDTIERDLQANPVVEDLVYESQEQAFANFQQIFAGDPTITQNVTPEDLPESFRVKLTDPERYDVVATQFEGYPGVEDVFDQRAILDQFFRLMNTLLYGASGMALLQLLGAAALIANTIRLTAFARREQTGIMKLVGATNWYIRLPFMVEGIVAGVLGALLAGGLLALGMSTLVSNVRQDIVFVPIVTMTHVWQTLPWLLATSIVAATVASFLALRRFLDV